MTPKTLTQTLFIALLLLAGLYVYFVNIMVFDAANREKNLSQIQDLSSQVATLEAKYVVLSGKVTLELAYNLGFQETGNTAFALAR